MRSKGVGGVRGKGGQGGRRGWVREQDFLVDSFGVNNVYWGMIGHLDLKDGGGIGRVERVFELVKIYAANAFMNVCASLCNFMYLCF